MATVKKIIIADDTSMHRTMLKSILRTTGAELGLQFEIVGEGESGGQLVELYSKEPKGSIDLVFSDIRMPVMDGLSALVKIKQLDPKQKVIMVSSEDIQSIDRANAAHGEEARKTVEQAQRMALLEKVAVRIRDNSTQEGKTNSILTGCEKLALDPIWVAEQFGASGYLKKPFDLVKAKAILESVVIAQTNKFIAKV